jgi:hypothetical protein
MAVVLVPNFGCELIKSLGWNFRKTFGDFLRRRILDRSGGEFAPLAAEEAASRGAHREAAAQYAGVIEKEFPPQSIVAWYPRVGPLVDDRPINEYFFVRRNLANWWRPAEATGP